jgi:hypothetical protein
MTIVERGALAVRAGKARNVAHEQVGVGATFDHRGVAAHGAILQTDMGPVQQSRNALGVYRAGGVFPREAGAAFISRLVAEQAHQPLARPR